MMQHDAEQSKHLPFQYGKDDPQQSDEEEEESLHLLKFPAMSGLIS